jgi:hypothetical protein
MFSTITFLPTKHRLSLLRKLAAACLAPSAAGVSHPPIHLASQNVRVVQPNLVYAVGLSLDICHEEALRDAQYFGQFGRTLKISINRSNQYSSALTRHGPTGSAYVTFKRPEGRGAWRRGRGGGG